MLPFSFASRVSSDLAYLFKGGQLLESPFTFSVEANNNGVFFAVFFKTQNHKNINSQQKPNCCSNICFPESHLQQHGEA